MERRSRLGEEWSRGLEVSGSRGGQALRREHRATTRPRNRATSGFTLAGVLVILSVMLIFLAYTVPRQWSAIMQRERERQTIYAMQQYARACYEFQKKNQTYPVNPNQLKEARSPRMIRGPKGEIVDPLTGQVDWLVVTQAAAAAIPQQAGTNPNGNVGGVSVGGGVGAGAAPPPPGSTANANMPGQTTGTPPGIPLKDYAGGPFVGVRPPISGKSLLSLNGNETYETWSYTAIDLGNDIKKRMLGMAITYK